MDAIDIAEERFQALKTDIERYGESICTEHDTRVKAIDRMFMEVLGWNYEDFRTEEKSGPGFLDYKFIIDDCARLIVEAKRDGHDFQLKNRSAGQPYKLNGTVFSSEIAKGAIAQAILYSGHKNNELACVTNGREWIIFRANRLGDGKDTLDGKAFLFSDLESISEKFTLFFDLLSYEAVKSFRYRGFFQEAEGIVIQANSFKRSMIDPESRRVIGSDELLRSLSDVMNSFFRRLAGDEDPELLNQCFVVTRESMVADNKLVRMSEDIISRVHELKADTGEELSALINKVRSSQRKEFVLIIGTKGAGKSTFIERFFRIILPDTQKEDICVAKVNLGDSTGDENSLVGWLNFELLKQIELSLFNEGQPTYEELQGICFDEYLRLLRGPWKPLYDTDKTKFHIEFGNHIDQLRRNSPHEYICLLIRHIVRNRKKVPCIIFDNADHYSINYQERAFQYARSIYEREICLVIMPITDKTSWHLSQDGAFQSFDNETLYLPTPDIRRIFERRIAYLSKKIDEENGGSKKDAGTGYFFQRGINISVENLHAFTQALQHIFLQTGNVSNWIARLSNYDVRRCLEITRNLMSSPHLGLTALIHVYFSGSSIVIPEYKVQRAIIKKRYDIYPVGQNEYVQNIYDMNVNNYSSPLLGLRMLSLLLTLYRDKANEGYITIEHLVSYFNGMHVERRVTLQWLEQMLLTGMCYPYDPRDIRIKAVNRVKISPSGIQHFFWGLKSRDYIYPMLEITPIYDREAYEKLTALYPEKNTKEGFRKLIEAFVSYLIDRDKIYLQVPDHANYSNQISLHRSMQHAQEK